MALGADVLDESGGGIDTLDFRSTTTRNVVLSLNSVAAQVVNAGLTLSLGSTTAFENVIGGSLNDVIIGNALNNTFTGGPGNDNLNAGLGNDIYLFDTDFSSGSDILNEAGGIDTLDFSATTTRSVAINLGSVALQVVNAGLSLTLVSGLTFENVIGGSLGDIIVGNALGNTLTGGGGSDSINGATGDDIYRFDTDLALGSDVISDSGGVDTLDFSSTTTRTISLNLGIPGPQVVNLVSP